MKRLINSFKHAIRGLYFVATREKNMQLHILIAFLVLILAFILKLNLLITFLFRLK